jgi:hypothetical protein
MQMLAGALVGRRVGAFPSLKPKMRLGQRRFDKKLLVYVNKAKFPR